MHGGLCEPTELRSQARGVAGTSRKDEKSVPHYVPKNFQLEIRIKLMDNGLARYSHQNEGDSKPAQDFLVVGNHIGELVRFSGSEL
jgi:hypothetical protein